MSENPKDLAAKGRVPLHLLPAAGRIYGALACRDGAAKYGPYNWREKPISLMGYTGAMERHLLAIRDGEDLAADSLCEHLGHVIATASIILDARECGALIDDRPLPGPAARLLEEAKQDTFPDSLLPGRCESELARYNLPNLRCTGDDAHEGCHGAYAPGDPHADDDRRRW